MTLPANTRLTLSIWPFVLIAPPEILAATLLIDREQKATLLSSPLAVTVVGVGLSFLVALALVGFARALSARSRATWLRSTWGKITIYSFISIIQSTMAFLLLDGLTTLSTFPPLLTFLYIASRPISVIVYALVISQLTEGVRTMRRVNGAVAGRLDLARVTNGMLLAAEGAMREESQRTLRSQVATPLSQLTQRAAQASDEELADDLDAFIDQRLRPLSHVLHPVSVRLGLVSAVRSLDSAATLDATRAVEKMDRDGVLLDDDVRVQVYRWIRDRLTGTGGAQVAFVMRGRELEVSVHPVRSAGLDAVQVVAGLRELRPGVLAAPLRGQIPSAQELASAQEFDVEPIHVRQRLREVLTERLPHRAELVALISLGAAPMQLVVFRWDVEWTSMAAVLTFIVVAIALSAILALLPQARPTIPGATRVVLEWVAVGVTPAVSFALVAYAVGLTASPWANLEFDIFRGIYRFTITGLMLVIAHGVVVQANRALLTTNAALDAEDQRREAILVQSRQLEADVAEALHRTVQGRLAAAVVLLRLGRGVQAREILDDMAGIEIPLLLERIQPHAGAAPQAPDGLVLRMHVSEDDLPASLSADVRTAVGEIAVNARRHGSATELDVTIVRAHGVWVVQCQDNGRGLAANATPGLGSRLLDEICARHEGRWHMATTEAGALVTIELTVTSMDRERATLSA